MQRIGPKMRLVVYYSSEPRCIIDVARLVGPHKSIKYGYATINRALRAGLVRRVAIPGRRGCGIVAV